MTLRCKFPNTEKMLPVGNQAGFTLTEMLVVLAILSAVSALVFPQIAGRDKHSRVEKFENSLANLLREARDKATFTNQSVAVVFHPQQRQFSDAADKNSIAVPGNVEIVFTTARNEIDQKVAKIRFFADGTSTGGCIKMTTIKTARRICINWLTGNLSRQSLEKSGEIVE